MADREQGKSSLHIPRNTVFVLEWDLTVKRKVCCEGSSWDLLWLLVSVSPFLPYPTNVLFWSLHLQRQNKTNNQNPASRWLGHNVGLYYTAPLPSYHLALSPEPVVLALYIYWGGGVRPLICAIAIRQHTLWVTEGLQGLPSWSAILLCFLLELHLDWPAISYISSWESIRFNHMTSVAIQNGQTPTLRSDKFMRTKEQTN